MAARPGADRPGPRVFISYSHDNDWHKRQVLELSTLLHSQLGIDPRLDQAAEIDRIDWSSWAINEIDTCDFVLAIASPLYRTRADGRPEADPSGGAGARFEGALLRNKLTQDRETWIRKILPVVLPGQTIDHIPEFLLPYSATHYIIEHLTPDGIAELRQVLTRKPTPPRPHPKSAEPQMQNVANIHDSRVKGNIRVGNTYKYRDEA